jgi:hypothetical protein
MSLHGSLRRLRRTSYGMLLLTAIGAGCVHAPARTTPAAEMMQVIRRTWSAPDTTLVARSEGRLAVVVRSADQPFQELVQARVQIATSDGAKMIASASVDSAGFVVFDPLGVGRYRVIVSRLGSATAVFTVPVESGCRTDLEVYIGMRFIGMAPPPPTPARAAATLCPVLPN